MLTLSHDHTDKMENPISVKEIKCVIKCLPTKKTPNPGGFTSEFYQGLKKEITSILHKMFLKVEEEGINTVLPKEFLESRITFIRKR